MVRAKCYEKINIIGEKLTLKALLDRCSLKLNTRPSPRWLLYSAGIEHPKEVAGTCLPSSTTYKTIIFCPFKHVLSCQLLKTPFHRHKPIFIIIIIVYFIFLIIRGFFKNVKLKRSDFTINSHF